MIQPEVNYTLNLWLAILESALEQSPKSSQISSMCNIYIYFSIYELITLVTGRKRCTRNTSKRSEEEIGLSEYDKNGLSDNGM